jgi:surface antigen-like variable number repeat protein
MHRRLIKVVRKTPAIALGSGLLIVSAFSFARAQDQRTGHGKFDHFGNVKTEDAMARLDAFAVRLNSNPNFHGLIIGHNQKDLGSGWLLRLGHGYLDYLVNKRGIDASRIKFVEGEPDREISFELWVLQAGETGPLVARVVESEPNSPQQFDTISLGDEGKCVGELFLELYTLEDGLRFFGEALRQQSQARAWIVIHPRSGESLAKANRTLNESRNLLIKNNGVRSERVLSAIGTRRSSICTDVNLWIAPSSSTKADEAAYYSHLMDDAMQSEYTVRRVEFSGNQHIRDNTLRRRFLQPAGDVFSRKVLEQSLKNLSRLRIIYPVTLSDVEVRLDRENKHVDFTIYSRERLYVRRGSRIY